MRWLALVLVIGACRASKPAAGEPCSANHECDYMADHACVNSVCRAPGKHGEVCGTCESGLFCSGSVCSTLDEVKAAEAKAAADKERALLAQSGVAPTAEATGPAVATGSRVRTVKATADRSAFAACRRDERLISGGCKGRSPTMESYPSSETADDTLGGRWNCVIGGGEVTAYALCEKVP